MKRSTHPELIGRFERQADRLFPLPEGIVAKKGDILDVQVGTESRQMVVVQRKGALYLRAKS